MQVQLAFLRRPVQPVVIGWQIEFAHPARNRRTLLDGHQPVVFAQMLADLARKLINPLMRGLDGHQDIFQSVVLDVGIAPERR